MINIQKVASEVSEHLAVFLQRGQNPTTLTWFSFVNSKGQQLSLKCKNKYRGSMGPFGLLFYPGKDSLNFHKKQTPQDRNQGLSLLFCKCFFSQRWLQVQLSHSFLEQVKFGKTRWHLRSAQVKFVLWQAPSTWKLQRTGRRASKPTNLYQCIHRYCLWVTKLPKTELSSGQARWKSCYHPAFIHPKHLFPCCFPWSNVIHWKIKASIKPCGHFEAIKSFFPPPKAVQTYSKQNSALNLFLYVVFHKIKFYAKKHI